MKYRLENQSLETLNALIIISSLAYNNDETMLASGSDDNTIKLWDVEK